MGLADRTPPAPMGGTTTAAMEHELAVTTASLGAMRCVLATPPPESQPVRSIIPAETLVQDGIAGENGTAGGPILGFLQGCMPSMLAHPGGRPG